MDLTEAEQADLERYLEALVMVRADVIARRRREFLEKLMEETPSGGSTRSGTDEATRRETKGEEA